METGIYKYAIAKWDENGARYYEYLRIRVEILKEHKTRYQVRYMEPHAKEPVNSVHWVFKKSVTPTNPTPKPAQQLELRLPYKDNE